MRWDTWSEVVRPILSEHFQVSNDKGYYSVLPSFTDIARVSLLAGQLPFNWKDYRGQATGDHNILAARLFGLANADRRDKLRVIVSSETDYGQRKLDQDVKPFNVLIYNLSDDWIHKFRDDVHELNETIARKVADDILPDLLNRVQDGDLVVVSSDHGFIELRQQDEIPVKVPRDQATYSDDDSRNPVVYRYLHNLEHPAGFKVQYAKNDFYTVAQGQQWFQREGGHFSRYSHGGISMAEMVIPGAVLKRIVVPEIKFELILLESAEIPEREESCVTAIVRNTGNRAGKFIATVKANTGESSRVEDKLQPGTEQTIELALTPRGKERVILTYEVSFKDLKGQEKRLAPLVLPIRVKLREDVVELGGLDVLDQLIEE